MPWILLKMKRSRKIQLVDIKLVFENSLKFPFNFVTELVDKKTTDSALFEFDVTKGGFEMTIDVWGPSEKIQFSNLELHLVFVHF